MTVDIVKRRARLAAATKIPWTTPQSSCGHMLLGADDRIVAESLRLRDDAVFLVGLVNEETELLAELEDARRHIAPKLAAARADALVAQAAELERLRRFRDAVMEFASVTSIGNACWSKRSFEVFPTLEACIADERAVLAKESGNGV